MNKADSNVVGYYEEYVEKILEIARLTTKENSILISFRIADGKCSSKVELLEHDGTKGPFKSVNFACTDSFYSEFLEKLIIEYSTCGNIILTDIIDIDGDNQFTFRMVGESNDLLSVDGISKDYAKKLKGLVEEEKEGSKTLVKTTDEAGISNSLGLLVMILMGIVIVLSWIVFI